MKIETHNINDIKIAEITSDETIITTSQDGLDLLGNLYYQGFDRIVLNEKNITPNFFDQYSSSQVSFTFTLAASCGLFLLKSSLIINNLLVNKEAVQK